MNKIKNIYENNKRKIFTGIALGCTVVNSYAWYKAGSKCSEIIKRKKDEMRFVKDGDKEATRAVVIETVKEVLPNVIVPSLSTIATGASILYANQLAVKEIAVLSTAYTMARNDLQDTKSKMKEFLGIEKTKEIEDKVTKDRFESSGMSPTNGQQIIITNNGTVKCKDEYTGRFFYSNAFAIQKAIDKLSIDIVSQEWVSLNDFYELIGLDYVKLGDSLGWHASSYGGTSIPVHFTALLDDDKTPCLVLEYDCEPKQRYLI